MNKAEATKQLKKKINLSKMPKAKARVAIARDVIAQLKLRRIQTDHDYANLEFSLTGPLKDLQDTHKEVNLKGLPRTECNVCALGSLFVANVDRVNGYTAVLDIDKFTNSAYTYVDRDDIIKRLKKYFSERQLDLIESAFEVSDFTSSGDGYGGTLDGKETVEATYAMEFGDNFFHDDQRLEAIMENIISNDGTFDPTRGYKKLSQRAIKAIDAEYRD